MGNHPSSGESRGAGINAAFRRSTGLLGLSKSELEERCKPSGLYPSCPWEDRAVRRLIADGKLAARLSGKDSRMTPSARECPICFLHYDQINITKCCHATICTECYLQVHPQKENMCMCPFCNNPKMNVVVAKKLNGKEVMDRETEEQKVIEATIHARANDDGRKVGSDLNKESHGGKDLESNDACETGFGSHLRERLRSRTMSSDNSSCIDDVDSISSMAMTAEERRKLEEEMRNQNNHPLSLRLQQEAEEARNRHERDHIENTANQLRNSRYEMGMALLQGRRLGSNNRHSMHGLARNMRGGSRLLRGRNRQSSRGRDWSPDHFSLIERAVLLDLEEVAAARRNGRQSPQASADSSVFNDNDSGGEGDANSALGENQMVEILRSFLEHRSLANSALRRSNTAESENENSRNGDDRDISFHNSAAYQIGTLSEEEQISMAIAMSLRDAEAERSQSNQESTNTENTDDDNPNDRSETEQSSSQTNTSS